MSYSYLLKILLSVALHTFLAIIITESPTFAKQLNIITIDSPPFGFTGKDGKPTGIMYEISNLIAKSAGFSYSNKLLPYSHTPQEISEGKADFVIRYSNLELKTNAIQVGTVVSFPTIIIGDATKEYKSLHDLHGKTVGVVKTGDFDEDFDSDTDI